MTATLSTPDSSTENPDAAPPNFIADLVREQLASGAIERVVTRFPPEPNGYLHIGHAKSICLNFGIAALAPNGACNLRMDDTNPCTEEDEYVRSIQEDVRWLGFEWSGETRYASDYFERIYASTETLIETGHAYVDSQSLEQIRATRGSFHQPGTDSPYRNRPASESLDLFRRMRAGEFADGAHVVRARIDMSSGNQNLRDPILYRIRRAHHHRTGDDWCIYPMYDYAHPLSDAIEAVTHSICTLEFEDHRPLYDWCLSALGVVSPPRQIEFARLALTYTVLSKRKLLQLVKDKVVDGWDDPRMPTLSGLRRRGYTPAALRSFCDAIGVAKKNGTVDVSLLEHHVREDLNATCARVMGVLRPLKIVLENFAEGQIEWFDAPYFPEAPEKGSRRVPLTREVYIDRDDFAEVPPKKWFRLAPGAEIRLRYACVIRCVGVTKDPSTGAVTELRCTWDPNSRGGSTADGRKIKGTSHWVSATHGVRVSARLYDRLFSTEFPGTDDAVDWLSEINPNSVETIDDAVVEPALSDAEPGSRWQFERVGYFCVDARESTKQRPVFNRTIGLKDPYAAKLKSTEPGR